ncbi:TIGR00725 family protein [Streptomyces sp. NPDC001852]|uniref:TIGR00725 family protein n=1 Tax=Streptomyces sp. NPDC001852 TaxID=3364619 RepID=UPI0036CAC06F
MSGQYAAPYVAVVGPAAATPREVEMARQVGSLLAQRRCIVVCGGLGGVMEAVCRGARTEGGTTVGLLPGTSRAQGNPFLTVALATGLGELRNGLIVRSADAVIVVGGSWGTLSEMALAVRTGTPTVAIGGWDIGGPDRFRTGVKQARSAAEAVETALTAIAGHSPA